MKIFLFLFTFLLVPCLSFPATLTKIPYNSLGRDIKTLIPSANDVLLPTTMALRADSTYEAAANLLTIPLYAYNPALGIGASAAIGYAFHGLYDVPKAYEQKVLQEKPSVAPILEELFGGDTAPLPALNDIVDADYIKSAHPGIETNPLWPPYAGNWQLSTIGGVQQKNDYSGLSYWVSININNSTTFKFSTYKRVGSSYVVEYQTFIYNNTVLPTTLQNEPSIPEILSVEQLEALHQRLVEEVSNNQNVRQDIEDSVVENPDLVPDAENIKRTDVQHWSNQNSSQINNEYIAELEQLAAANPDNVHIQQELAQAQAQAQKEAETPVETFDPIPGIEVTPYDPGPFDIPSRFETFLANIVDTGLFSLPSQFFDSLPAGGSPIYTINAGQYGTHTVDLSETMGSGLLVLKTLLIGCFTFLAVRVVVLKR